MFEERFAYELSTLPTKGNYREIGVIFRAFPLHTGRLNFTKGEIKTEFDWFALLAIF